jgi:hypothetical protein
MKTGLSKLNDAWHAIVPEQKRSRKVELTKEMERNLTTLDTIVLVASITSLLALSLAQQIVGVNLLQKPEEKPEGE